MIAPNLKPDDRAAEFRNPPERIGKTLSNDIVPISVIDEYERWAKAVLSEEHLADVPPIPLEAMRREAIYEGRDLTADQLRGQS